MFHYNYALLLQDKLTFAAYFTLLISIIFCYLAKSFFLRSVVFGVALLLALYSGRVNWEGLTIVLAIGGLFYAAFQTRAKLWRRIFYGVVLFLAAVLPLIKLPGIHNWRVVSNILLTPDALPYSLTFNFDKSLFGLFFLWFATYTVANVGKWKDVLTWREFKITFLAIVVLTPLSYFLGFVRFEPKLTNFFYLWAIHNLFFTCIAEEAIFRGMILKSLLLTLQTIKGGKWLALVISAVIFGLAHYLGGPKYMLLATVAGLFYGYAFMKTDKIEASILTHFAVNIVHFLAFTYPALRMSF